VPIENLEGLTRDVSALFVAFRSGAAVEDVTVYVNLLSKNLDDREWDYAFKLFTQEVPEEGRGSFMPTVAQLVTAGHHAPKPEPQIARRSRLDPERPFWKSEAEREFYEAVVHDNPFEPEKGEQAIDYIQRIAITVGAKPLSAFSEFRPRNAAHFAKHIRRQLGETGETEADGERMPCGCKGSPGVLGTMSHLAGQHGWGREELLRWLDAEGAP